MDQDLRDILTAVREGRLDPAEGARRLQQRPAEPASDRTRGEAAPGTSSDRPAGDSGSGSGSVWSAVTDPVDPVDRAPATGPQRFPDAERRVHTPTAVVVDDRTTTSLRVRAITRKVRVVGDPAIRTVSVRGPHELRREGTALVLDSEWDLPFGDPFAFLPSAMGRFRVQSPGRSFPWGSELEIRVNPTIDLDVDVTAGSLHVERVGRVRARVTAGSVGVEDVLGPIDLHVIGGTAKIDTVVAGGDHRIRCDSGSVVLRLRAGSDVRFRPDAQLGRVVVDGVEGGREITVGAGTGRLRAEVIMGSIQVEGAE